ncbi:Uncharacterized protein APZ42_025875 [Daphnia magna]|uniref:Uncharacterized protein n=1 Tax=Daphnia magna TaxID=35525 RepID=A0A0P6B6K1_9CRUS|nr:Uncharacterized protein APZ42_025875 [Daphnia magna]
MQVLTLSLKEDKSRMAFRLGGLVFLSLCMAIVLTSGLQNPGSSARRPEALFQSLFLWTSALLCFYDCLVMIAIYRNAEVNINLEVHIKGN